MIAGHVLSALLYLTIGRYPFTTDFNAMALTRQARRSKTKSRNE
jgi:hypothetical protein